MISVSLVDYLGQIDDGVGVILSLVIQEKVYEIMYWFNPSNDFTIVIDNQFYIDFPKVKDIYEYDRLIDLLFHIDTEVLPERSEIFKEFLES